MNALAHLAPVVLAAVLVMTAGGCASTEKTGSTEADSAIALSGMQMTPHRDWIAQDFQSAMRVAQYKLESDESEPASLIVYFFGAASAGSIQANLDRWCGQFEQPDGRDSRDAATIDTFETNGLEVVTLDVGGTYVAETTPGSGERVNKPDSRLLAAVVTTDAGPYYIKLVGPAATIEQWRESYDALIASLAPAPVIGNPGGAREHPN